MKRVDARGLSCPEPVIRAKNAMESGDKEYEILVDNVVAKENVSRFANHQGYQVQVEEQETISCLRSENDHIYCYLLFPLWSYSVQKKLRRHESESRSHASTQRLKLFLWNLCPVSHGIHFPGNNRRSGTDRQSGTAGICGDLSCG